MYLLKHYFRNFQRLVKNIGVFIILLFDLVDKIITMNCERSLYVQNLKLPSNLLYLTPTFDPF
jgi:hypothetical protein